jgi:hypothetical protein
MKRFFSTFAFLLGATALFAQDSASEIKSFQQDPFNHPHLSLYVVTTMGAVVLLLIAIVFICVWRVIRLLRKDVRKEAIANAIRKDVRANSFLQGV